MFQYVSIWYWLIRWWCESHKIQVEVCWNHFQSGQLFAYLCCTCVQVSGTCQDRALRGGHVSGTLRLLLGCGFRMHRVQLPLGVGQCRCRGSGHRHLGPSCGNGRGSWPGPVGGHSSKSDGGGVGFDRRRSPSKRRPRPAPQKSDSRRRPRLGTGGARGFAAGGQFPENAVGDVGFWHMTDIWFDISHSQERFSNEFCQCGGFLRCFWHLEHQMIVELSISMAKHEETTPWLQVALQILFSQEVRKDPFVLMSAGVSIFFGLKKLHEVIKFFCCEKKSGYEEFELDSDSSDWWYEHGHRMSQEQSFLWSPWQSRIQNYVHANFRLLTSTLKENIRWNVGDLLGGGIWWSGKPSSRPCLAAAVPLTRPRNSVLFMHTCLEGGRHGPFFKALGRQDRWINLERLDRCVGFNCVFSIFGRPRCWIRLFFFFFIFALLIF